MDVMERRRELIARAKGTLKYWWTAEDAPINTKWVDRINGLEFQIYGNNVYDSVNKIYNFGLSTQYGRLTQDLNTVNFSMGHHWRLEFDIYFNRSASIKSTTWFDVGSVFASSHAIGFNMGSITENENTYRIRSFFNWKMLGNESNPFPLGTGPTHPAFPLIPTNDFAHAVGYYKIVDGKNGYDCAKVFVNNQLLISDAIVPQVEYGPVWNQNYLYIGRGYNEGYKGSCKVKYVKIWVYD